MDIFLQGQNTSRMLNKYRNKNIKHNKTEIRTPQLIFTTFTTGNS